MTQIFLIRFLFTLQTHQFLFIRLDRCGIELEIKKLNFSGASLIELIKNESSNNRTELDLWENVTGSESSRSGIK